MLVSVSGGMNQTMWHKPRLSQLARGLFSFRQGGRSLPPYQSLNIGLHVGDDEQHVRQNRELVARELGVPLEQFVFAEQVHGNQVAVVGERLAGRGAFAYVDAVPGVDALVTNVPGMALAVQSADCVPILFYDPVQQVIAAAHSGWKGTLSHIAHRVIDTMVERFSVSPQNLLVALGPSIRSCCYEVDSRVGSQFEATFGRAFVMPTFGDAAHFQLNLQACIRQDLLKAGVPLDGIEDCGLCTGCRTDLLFSHRMEQGRTGRLIGAVTLRGKGVRQ